MWLIEPFLRCARFDDEEGAQPYLGVDDHSLLASQDFIEELHGSCSVTAEPLGPVAGPEHGILAKATPPTEVVVVVPKDHSPGQLLRGQGPFGEVQLPPPPGCQPGDSLRFRLAPPILFKITVPPWARGGYEARFQLDAGDEVSVKVPLGLQPGDVFEVLPPAMMVQVPASASTGDQIVFQGEAKGPGCPAGWYRIRLQEDHKPGSVLSVRIPPPSKVMQEQGALLPPAAPAMEDLEPLPRVSLSALPTG